MEFDSRKLVMSAVVWPNLAVGVVVLVLVMSGQVRGSHELLVVLARALVYANFVAWFGVLAFMGLAKHWFSREPSMVTLLATCIFIIIPVGALVIQATLMLLGLQVRQAFWQTYFATLRVSLPLAMVFGAGAMVHSSVRERLERTEAKLRQKELDEERAQTRAVEARLRLLEARIHPHFLFNTLNTISSLIAMDPARAENTVARLATLLRTSLDSSDRPLIPLHEELKLVHSYVEIERARFGDKLRASFDVASELQDTPVPPMSLQALVENAVKYGISPQPNGGDICVRATAENGNVRIEVSDSGGGFELSAVPPGHGLESLVERLQALFADKARLNASRRDGRCIVEMVVPRA